MGAIYFDKHGDMHPCTRERDTLTFRVYHFHHDGSVTVGSKNVTAPESANRSFYGAHEPDCWIPFAA